MPQDAEQLFDAIDTNKDGLISVNEFCLCVIGTQQSLDQRLRAFDPDLEKNLKDEINFLFDFFDSDKNGAISMAELSAALKANNSGTTQAQIELMMKQTNVSNSGGISRKEFMDMLLPQMK